MLKDRRGRQLQTTPGLKDCVANPDTGSPGVYSDSKGYYYYFHSGG